MRKLYVSILLVPIIVLFVGALNISSICPAIPQATCQGGTDDCCKKDNAPCSKKEKPGCPKDQSSDHSDCCFNCPLCALITVPPFIRFEPTSIQSTTEYAVSPDNRLTDYNQPHWKPPDTASLT